MQTVRYYEVVAESDSGGYTMIWNSRIGWVNMDGNDGERTTYYTLEEADRQLGYASVDNGYLVDIRLVAQDVEVDEDEDEDEVEVDEETEYWIEVELDDDVDDEGSQYTSDD